MSTVIITNSCSITNGDPQNRRVSDSANEKEGLRLSPFWEFGMFQFCETIIYLLCANSLSTSCSEISLLHLCSIVIIGAHHPIHFVRRFPFLIFQWIRFDVSQKLFHHLRVSIFDKILTSNQVQQKISFLCLQYVQSGPSIYMNN